MEVLIGAIIGFIVFSPRQTGRFLYKIHAGYLAQKKLETCPSSNSSS